MKKEIVILIIGIVIIGGGILFYETAPPTSSLKTVNCFDDPYSMFYIPDLTEEECEKEKEKTIQLKKEVNEAGEKLGCGYYQMGYCKVAEKTYRYLLDRWVETDTSKFCSPYADGKVSDVPVKCLSYFRLTK